ncbi:MAG: HemK/PrmC family methyltransferase [Candidatus Omnitrophota bacterium]|nr:HemK/PrmC family methyltransferase [Candidatus Omnitrophota bacterium]
MNEAELLFSEILKTDRLSLYLDKDKPMDKACGLKVSSVMRRRIKGEPIQYILGKTEFMGLEFGVSPDVLIPRPETEILVETAIRLSSVVRIPSSVYRRPSFVNRNLSSTINILDIGSGSGCIAISLAKYLPGAKVDAIDISLAALEIAKQNAILNKVEVTFIQSDLFNVFRKRTTNDPSTWFDFAHHRSLGVNERPLDLVRLRSPQVARGKRTTNDERRTTKYNLIVSNPPYIPSDEISRLQPEIQYEPRLSLDGGADGLDFYYRLINDAPAHLEPGGYLLLEIGFGQESAIKNILQNSRKFEIIEVVRDYNNIGRVVVARVLGNG